MDDGDLYSLGIAKPLDEKIELALGNIRHYSRAAATWDMFEPWYHVCNSFGKDSTVLKRLMEMADVPFKLYHNLTTLDPPELIRFGRKHYPDTIIHKPAKPMLVW